MSVELSNAQQFISWMNIKAYLNTIAQNAAKRFGRYTGVILGSISAVK